MARSKLPANSVPANPTFEDLLAAKEMAQRDLDDLIDDPDNKEMDFYCGVYFSALERVLLAPVQTHQQLATKLKLAHNNDIWRQHLADAVVAAILEDIASLDNQPRELALKSTPHI